MKFYVKILFVFCLISLTQNANAIKRKMFIHEIFYSHSIDPKIGSEISILVSNLSSVNQTVDFSNLRAEVFYKTTTNDNKKVTATTTAKIIGSSITPATRTASQTNPVQLPPTAGQNILQILMSISPQTTTAPYLGYRTLGGLNPNELAAGDNVNNITITGYLEVSDTDPTSSAGFVVGSGSIIKPSDVSGFGAVETLDFRINNGKAF